ncbi:class I SAM-dependent methyltransferase [Chitinilyticum piscinae]|uniref:SAM-dependent methyltransferase n=1 Tax=Chitinilyticum piscinae TaxID=2866724 RepID=A0A8J7FGS1_9NEIS|nr:SAM-dependent methyltransferase [Chitinilyticum piscinae]MBE9607860.1 SAM-dependent methyltransferase [Chitinilyticum piscinae]
MNQAQLPAPTPEAFAHSQALVAALRQQIADAGGWISFADYMRSALYAPGLGYYSGGATKFGEAGDFITAPEISPLFGQSLAQTVATVLADVPDGIVLELGAGTGKLAVQLLGELERLESLPARYCILDLSAELRERQRATIAATLPQLLDRVEWLDALPAQWQGMLVANEVLDAVPCQLVHRDAAGTLFERGVSVGEQGFAFSDRPLQDAALAQAASILPDDYTSEFQPEAAALIGSCAAGLTRGAMLWLDYGFPAREFYHPQRSEGTLMGHYRHHSIHDPFWLPGLTDLTCHVDFSAIYSAGHAAGLALEGYVSQGQYLLDCGILQSFEAHTPELDDKQRIMALNAVQKLLSPAEMGELFKVIAFSRGLSGNSLLPGFRSADRSGAL